MNVRRSSVTIAAIGETIAVIVLGGGILSCSSTTCSPSIQNGLEVVVTDGATRTPVCGATVVAHDGAYVETLAGGESSARNGCFGTYTGANERAGNYEIDVSVAGGSFQPATARAVVPEDGCHVVPQQVKVTLTRM